LKIVGIVKSIIGTDAVIAIDEDGNQRAIFPGDTLYDNEKLLELSGVQVNVEPVTVADAQKKSEPKSDKEVASLQDALLNGKDISELEETAAGGNAGGGNASSDGVSLGAASFVASGHESSIHADTNAISEVAPASVAGVTNVSGGAEEFTSSLETLTVANELLNPQPTPVVSETPVAITPATPGEIVTPSTPVVETPAVSEQPANPSEPANPGTWEEPIVVDPSDPHYDHSHHFDDEPTTPSTPTPSTPALPSNPVNEDDDSDEDDHDQPTPPAPSGNDWFALDGIIDNAVDREADSDILVGWYGDETIKYDGGLYKFQGDIEENVHDEAHIIYTNDNTPSLRGSATPGATIKVYNEAGAVIATHTVDDSLIYDIELPLLADGAYKFKMETISPTTGEVFATKETTPFTVDTNAPTIEWTKLPDDISGGGRINKPNGEEIEFAGKTEPFADVKFIVYDNALGNSVVMQVRADEHGEFSQKIPDAFPGGIYDVSVQVTDPAGNWVAPIKLPVTEAPIVQPVTPAPSEPAHISDNIFEITRMYTDEDSDLKTEYVPWQGTDGFDFKPTFEGKATAFADIALSIAKQGRYNWQAPGLHDPDIPVDVLTTKADADGNWKVESSKDYAQGSHKITADVTHTDGNTYHSSTEMFYMPMDPVVVAPVDHL
jgi:hemagglutinin/hemolysin-like protein